jgi:hypothetical protein
MHLSLIPNAIPSNFPVGQIPSSFYSLPIIEMQLKKKCCKKYKKKGKYCKSCPNR